MAGGNWTKLLTVVTGDLITASERNNEFDNVIANANQDGIASASEDLGHMQATTDPFAGSSPVLATAGRGEVTGLRYILALLTGKTYWYQHPDYSLAQVGPVVVPLGGIIEYPIATPPNSSFLAADGTAISRSTYATLFALIGSTFGSGDGTTTFNLPNYKNRMSIGAGDTYAPGDTGGATSGAATITDPGHTHTENSHTHTMGNHTHSTPAHTHVLSTTVITANGGGTTINVVDDGSGNLVTKSTSPTPSNAYNKNTTSGGNGTSGTPSSNTTDATTPTINSTTTGISATTPTLPPYLGMYKMMRVL